MALSLNKYNNILDLTNEEDEISSKDHEKTSTNTSTHFSNSFSSSDTSNVKDFSLSDHELDDQEPSLKKKKKHPDCSGLVQLKKPSSPVLPQQLSALKNHAEVAHFPGTPVSTDKNVLNLAEGQFFILSIMEVMLITVKMKTVILALISIIIIL